MQNMKNVKKTAVVSIIMGSQSDWETMQCAVQILDSFSINYEVKIVSAHRTPDRLYKYAKSNPHSLPCSIVVSIKSFT